jgi:putative transposase
VAGLHDFRGMQRGTARANAPLVTAPRQVIPATSYLVSRRCAQRQFLLKPSKLTCTVFGYVLAVAAARYGVLLHACVVMSNHYHLVLTDVRGQLPLFGQFLDSLVARAMNASYGRWEAFWAPSSYSAVTLVTKDDVIEKAAYTLANPAASGLVASGTEWPGLWSGPDAVVDEPLTFERPDHFFDPKGSMPKSATLVFSSPPGFPAEEFRERLSNRVSEFEQEAAKTLKAEGRTAMGARRVLTQKHTDRPGGGEPRRKLNPRIAARHKWKRIEALGRLKSFLREYRVALAQLRAAVKDVVFPHGTYYLRVHLGVPCAAAG